MVVCKIGSVRVGLKGKGGECKWEEPFLSIVLNTSVLASWVLFYNAATNTPTFCCSLPLSWLARTFTADLSIFRVINSSCKYSELEEGGREKYLYPGCSSFYLDVTN